MVSCCRTGDCVVEVEESEFLEAKWASVERVEDGLEERKQGVTSED